jgi:Family of unknown function (DUF6492)
MTDPSRTQVETQLVVVTPTYAPDLDLFSDLHNSVLRWFPTRVRHLVVVNDSDVALFRRFEGPRCLVVGVGDVLPRSVRALPVGKLWVNLRRPVPPLRGWIVQQLVKLAVAELVPESVVVMADSDLVFIRPITVDTFVSGGRVRLYRKDAGIDDSLPRHVRWHAVARQLLGLPPPPAPPLPDYVSSLNIWDREVVRRTLRRIEDVTGRRWLDAIGDELHFSEWTLYGVFCRRARACKDVAITSDSLCHSYWDTVPLTAEGAAALLSSVGSQDVAYIIGAKSHTPLSVRRTAHAQRYGS